MLDQPYYEPGSQVTGNVYLRVTRTISGVKGIKFEMKGGGKNTFIRFYTETTHDAEGNPEVERREEKLKKSKKFLGYEQEFKGELPEELDGDYKLGFTFTLPDHIPSSLMFKDKKKRTKPSAKIKYFVKAKLMCRDDDMEMKHKAVMAVRERAEEMKE